MLKFDLNKVKVENMIHNINNGNTKKFNIHSQFYNFSLPIYT